MTEIPDREELASHEADGVYPSFPVPEGQPAEPETSPADDFDEAAAYPANQGDVGAE